MEIGSVTSHHRASHMENVSCGFPLVHLLNVSILILDCVTSALRMLVNLYELTKWFPSIRFELLQSPSLAA